jgi:shikimate dehydrogenase
VPGRLVLLGHPLGHTLSPVFQNAALRAAGIPVKYEALDVPRSALRATLNDLHIARAAGNVTIPYKEDVAEACDRLTPAARAVGAVNTFWTAVDGARVGDNTDVGGFVGAVRTLIGDALPGGTIALLGAGGAARAVMHALEDWPGTRVRLWGRTPARATELLQRFRVAGEVVNSASEAAEGALLVVNATPVGLRATDALPVPVESLSPDAAVFDLVYSAAETPLVRYARARGHPAMDGLAMLVEQGALAFERWFGIAPDRDVMWKSLGRGAMMT